jgi:ABC-type lipoprotein export system ATPase subunit
VPPGADLCKLSAPLLVDEPTSRLDTAGRDEVMTALETVNAERQTTIVGGPTTTRWAPAPAGR